MAFLRRILTHGREAAVIQQGLPEICGIIDKIDFSNFPAANFWRFLMNPSPRTFKDAENRR
jgi:hypothetical protein